MDLLERYLQAIGQNLPPATRDDVLNELRANLSAEIDDRAESLNRPLTEPEVAAILKAHGRPEVVATRYLPQRYLIGPTLFPYYILTMRRVLPFVVLIYGIANAVRLIVSQHGLRWIASDLVSIVFQLIPTLFIWLAVMTLIFVILEQTYDKFGASWNLNDWNPTKLPRLKPNNGKKERSLIGRVADLAFHCLWMAYIIEVPRHPYILFGPGWLYINALQVTWAPVWHTFYVALWFVLLIQLGTKIASLFDALQPWYVPLDMASKLIGALVTGWLASAGTYVVPTGPATNPHTLAVVNHWTAIGLRFTLAFIIADIAIQAWKYLRPHIPIARLAV
jgi:hypothetical protein